MAMVKLRHLHHNNSMNVAGHASAKISHFAILAENDLESVLDA